MAFEQMSLGNIPGGGHGHPYASMPSKGGSAAEKLLMMIGQALGMQTGQSFGMKSGANARSTHVLDRLPGSPLAKLQLLRRLGVLRAPYKGDPNSMYREFAPDVQNDPDYSAYATTQAIAPGVGPNPSSAGNYLPSGMPAQPGVNYWNAPSQGAAPPAGGAAPVAAPNQVAPWEQPDPSYPAGRAPQAYGPRASLLRRRYAQGMHR